MFSLLFFFLSKFTCRRTLKRHVKDNQMEERPKIIISKIMQFVTVYYKFITYIAIKFCFFSPKRNYILTDFHGLMRKQSSHYPFQIYIQKKYICSHLQLVNLDAAQINTQSVLYPLACDMPASISCL
jgi:hypothetical protein